MKFFKNADKKTAVKTHYLIDLENVQTEGFSGCDKLTEDSMIHIFYTENSKKIDLDIIAVLGHARVELHKVSAGKQSLDMHLISFLGYLIGANEGKDVSFVIISKDTDYDNAVNFWKEQKQADVQRRKRIDPNYVEEKPKTSQTRYSNGYKRNGNGRYGSRGNYRSNYNNKTEQKPEIKFEDKSEVKLEEKTLIKEEVKAEPLTEIKVEAVEKAKVETVIEQPAPVEETPVKDSSEKKPASNSKSSNKKPSGKKPSNKKPATQNNNASKQKEANPEAVSKALEAAGFTNGEAEYINNLIKNNPEDKSVKQLVYRAVISKYKQETGLKIYNSVKKYI